jgi:signal transduction histidine kinase
MRARTTWLLFAIACAMVFAVMVGVSWALVRLDGSRVATEREAVREELVRLALWRMDSAITPLLSREIAEAGMRGADEPLPAGVRARFVIHPGGRTEVIRSADADAERSLLAMIEARPELDTLLADATPNKLAGNYRAAKSGIAASSFDQSQAVRNELEYNKRVASVQDNLYASSLVNPTFEAEQISTRGALEEDGSGQPLAILETMRPLWWGDGELMMIRRVRTADGERIDGSWLDWTAVRGILGAEIADLLPTATLVPITGDAQMDFSRRLATLPIGLEPGALDLADDPGARPLRVAIGAAWAFVVVAVGAVAVLLRGSLSLSERRAAFVSAVTHELRTPLTTFRMYTEMLAEGMVDDERRDRYVSTLRREAERLGQLVENVLAYARIEADHGRRRAIEVETIAIDRVVDRCAARLGDRCRTAGLELDVVVDASDCSVRVDLVAVEQILFNLVDNAAKYGATEADPSIELRVSRVGSTIEIAVRDFGPGVPEAERTRVFEPFAKASAHEAGTKPGVGLGLALSRRLAVQMGGKLELRAAERGAMFVLTLPVA